ncbi:hypothetical protein CTheo_6032 [Ceratobasidium theobromae]|uniref:Transmembrane protein n=1 Tax=Ceratobasidium theobromae TaxID=1582974 RepID=A0A5N5QG75_9AGAM|nr:hypothetical protein CTheo_6032 [Ceratobasidium theobromae]
MSVPSLRERKQKRVTSFAAISKEVDPENEDLILHRRERLIPWSKSPFFDRLTIQYRELREQRRQSSLHGTTTPAPNQAEAYVGMLTADEIKDVDKSNDEERGERPPAWLDLFYDLAWASTFSNLTQNSTISGGEESLSYAVFFSMVWWMWVSQVSYDIRFYSNDWFHRVLVFLQLCVFGSLSAFTSKFDVTAYVGGADIDPNQRILDQINGVSAAQQAANEAANERIPQLSFFGIALVIGISRAMLCAQYIRVWLYAHDKRDPAVVVKPLAMFISAGLWFGSFAMLYLSGYTNDAAHISKFIMWGVATAIEIAGHWFAPPPNHLRSMGSLTSRLANLVTIILGEGLNGITGTLRFSVQALGFNARSVGMVISTAVVVYLSFYLYFEGSRPRISKNRRSLWIFLHLPYMLSLILLLEGLKNLLLYSASLLTLYTSCVFIFETFLTNVNAASKLPSDQFTQALTASMTPFLAKIGFSWEDGWQKIINAALATNSTDARNIAIENGVYRLLLNITVKIFDQFETDGISAEGQVAIHEYLINDTFVQLDVNDPDHLPSFAKVFDVLAFPHIQGARWISALAGGTLIFLALINVTQSWPKGTALLFFQVCTDSLVDRYAWGSVLSRFLNGVILMGLLFLNLGSGSGSYVGGVTTRAAVWAWLDSYWTLPTLALSLVAQALIDQILLIMAVRSANQALERTYEPSALDPLRDTKDHAYDPPVVSSHLTGTPAQATFTPSPGTSTTPAPYNPYSSWQPSYVPPQQQHSGYTSPGPVHQTNYGFVAPPPPPPFPGSGGSGIPAGGIVTPSRPH